MTAEAGLYFLSVYVGGDASITPASEVATKQLLTFAEFRAISK